MSIEGEMHQKNGFVILRGCIEHELILDLQSYAGAFLKCDANPSAIIQAMEELESTDKDVFYQFCKKMGQIIPTIRIATQPKIITLIQEITKFKNLHLVDSAVFFNKESVKRLQYDWHQEQAYFPNASEVMTMWYPWLTPVNNANGTMVMASGGHKKVFARERINVTGGLTQMKISDDDLKEFEKIECDLNLGDAVIFTYMSPHRTGHNSSGVPRTTIITRFTDEVGAFANGWRAE